MIRNSEHPKSRKSADAIFFRPVEGTTLFLSGPHDITALLCTSTKFRNDEFHIMFKEIITENDFDLVADLFKGHQGVPAFDLPMSDGWSKVSLGTKHLKRYSGQLELKCGMLQSAFHIINLNS